MQVLSATGGIAATNCFVVADETTSQCVLIDAPDHTVGPLLDEIETRGWKLEALWLTHGHFDHIADHEVVRNRFPGVKILICDIEVPKLRKPGSSVFRLPFVIPPGEPDVLVKEGDVVRVGTLEAKVIFTPGHSPGHVCFYFEKQGLLVGGDLIIGGAVGRTDLPDASIIELEKSVRKVMALPDEVTLLAGHGPATTIGQERARNPYVRLAIEGRLAELG